MPADDRERSFENALASHLRAGGSAGAPRSACSEAEVLAAYHEGSLAPEQTALLKTHLTDCSRCQEILAHLGATDEIPVAAANIMPAPIAPAKTGVRVLPSRRPTFWPWVAPAGALAAALLVWVAVHENNSFPVPAKGPTLEAKRAEPAKDLPSSRSPAMPPPSGDAAQADKAASSPSFEALRTAPQSEVVGIPKELPHVLLKRKDSSSAGKKSAVPESFDELADSSPNRDALPEQLRSKAEVARNRAAKSDAKPESEEKAAIGRQDAPSADSLQPTPERGAIATAAPAAPPAAPPAPGPGASNGAALSESAAVSGRVTQQQEMSGMSRHKQKAEMRLANSIAEVTISAPDGHVSWRVGQAGVIEFSSDAEKTWILQPSGVVTDLLAGSATSDKICWIVGRAGTILRTTDGGAHWQKVRPPIQDDFRSVFAVDARQATVSPANGKYQTTDGGITWHKLPPE
jgi:Photosynthesis system II assembly factor YCF48